jgi:hypothetical protein
MKPLVLGCSLLASMACAAPGFAGFEVRGAGVRQLSSHGLDRPAEAVSLHQVSNENPGRGSTTFEVEQGAATAARDFGASRGTPTIFTTRTPLVQLNAEVNHPAGEDRHPAGEDSHAAGEGRGTSRWASPTLGTCDFRRDFEHFRPDEWTNHDRDRKCDEGSRTPGRHDGPKCITNHGRQLECCLPHRSDCCREPPGCDKPPGGQQPPGCNQPPGGSGPQGSPTPEPGSIIVWSLLGGAAACGHWVRRRRIPV